MNNAEQPYVGYADDVSCITVEFFKGSSVVSFFKLIG